MIIDKAVNETIQCLAKKALAGDLEPTSFYKSWPKEANENAFLKEVFEDIEDGVQHCPFSISTGELLTKDWRNSDAYSAIYLDLILLGLDNDLSELAKCRSFILKDRNLSIDSLNQRVKDFFI